MSSVVRFRFRIILITLNYKIRPASFQGSGTELSLGRWREEVACVHGPGTRKGQAGSAAPPASAAVSGFDAAALRQSRNWSGPTSVSFGVWFWVWMRRAGCTVVSALKCVMRS